MPVGGLGKSNPMSAPVGVALAQQEGESMSAGATRPPLGTPFVTLGRAMNGLCHLAVLQDGEVGFVLGSDATEQSGLDEFFEPLVENNQINAGFRKD